MRRRDFLARTGAAASLASAGRAARAGGTTPPAAGPSPVIAWNRALTAAIAATASGPTVAARALSMVHEAIYNAWAAYGNTNAFTLAGLRSRSKGEWTATNKTIAIGQAAHDVLVDLFPSAVASFDATLAQTLAGLATGSQAAVSANLFGKATAVALLQARHGDGSNQLGDLAGGTPYADWTSYVPLYGPDTDFKKTMPTHWQPLRVTSAEGVTSIQAVPDAALGSGAAVRPRRRRCLQAAVLDRQRADAGRDGTS